jgi:hypothetical protein
MQPAALQRGAQLTERAVIRVDVIGTRWGSARLNQVDP